jgi:predicted Fe-Mo cluster-binding NifX family protein
MQKARIAVPSTLPGGLDSEVSAHFGHCDIYTIIDVENGAVAQTSTLANVPHVQGGCMAPVQHLAQNGVTVLIAGGMGMRPLMGFNQVGIDVFYGAGAPNVGAAVDAFLQGKLVKFSQQHTCSGH